MKCLVKYCILYEHIKNHLYFHDTTGNRIIIISFPCNVLLKNFGSWHSSGCCFDTYHPHDHYYRPHTHPYGNGWTTGSPQQGVSLIPYMNGSRTTTKSLKLWPQIPNEQSIHGMQWTHAWRHHPTRPTGSTAKILVPTNTWAYWRSPVYFLKGQLELFWWHEKDQYNIRQMVLMQWLISVGAEGLVLETESCIFYTVCYIQYKFFRRCSCR